MTVCFTCRGKGTLDPDGCPECHKKMASGTHGVTDLTEDVLKSYEIPVEYMNISWDKEMLVRDHAEQKNDPKFIKYVSQLEKIITLFGSGLRVNQSAVIAAGPRMGKQVFAYNCLKLALQNRYSIVPILDNTQVRRMNILSADRPNSAYFREMGMTMEDLVCADIVFMTVDKDNAQSALPTFESLMDKRARRGKPTFLISRYSLKQMSPYGYDYESLRERSRSLNNLKYPTIISCPAANRL